MFFKKQGFPEEGELVLCTVTSVQYHSVFVNIDEYGRGGMIHISEVAPGRIRNIRDYVKEGKKVVCKILRINHEKGHIDLSLRRVNESEKRRKIDEIKKEQNAEKIVETIAVKIKMKADEFYNAISEKIFKKYKSLSKCFEDLIRGNIEHAELGIPDNHSSALTEAVKLRMKIPEVEVGGKLKITTYSPEGINIIKDSLKIVDEVGGGGISISYLGSGTYKITVKGSEYKEAEKKLKEGIEKAILNVEKSSGEAEFLKDP